ncbi:MAG: hypothetical protein JST92_26920, partial [Deltaproteobacteria bacterium]|nr:hypothetical protein [Deltaproteobacteria bacterium]
MTAMPAGAAPAANLAATTSALSHAPQPPAPVFPAATPLASGSFGTLSLPALALPEQGRLSFGLSAGLYRGGQFLLPDTTTLRAQESLAFSFGALSWLEVYGALGLKQTSANAADSKSLSSVGDVDLGGKVVLPWRGPVSGGASFELDLPSGVGSVSFAGLGFRAQVLGGLALNLGPVPLSTTLTVGYHLDNSGRLIDGTSIGTLQAFAEGISLYDQVTGGIALQSPLRYASPVVELVAEAPVARLQVLPAGGHPTRLRMLLGANAIGLGVRGLE